MTIQIYDAPEKLVKKLTEEDGFAFVQEVFRAIENVPYQGKWEIIAHLLHTIPIFLHNTQSTTIINPKTDITESWGGYFPNRKVERPYIELYLPAIYEAAGGEANYKWLFTMALIHEMAHATLDIFNYELKHSLEMSKVCQHVAYNTEFGRWFEESTANAMMLQVIRASGDKDFYDYAKTFMLAQTAEYALGARYEEFTEWDYRVFMQAKEAGVDARLKKRWLKLAQSDVDIDDVLVVNEMMAEEVAYFFNGEYYPKVLRFALVGDMVKKVLNDFEEKHNRKIRLTEFKDIFPKTPQGPGWTYTEEYHRDNYLYPLQVSLEDGYVNFIRYWKDREIKAFIAKSGCRYVTFHNWKEKPFSWELEHIE